MSYAGYSTSLLLEKPSLSVGIADLLWKLDFYFYFLNENRFAVCELGLKQLPTLFQQDLSPVLGPSWVSRGLKRSYNGWEKGEKGKETGSWQEEEGAARDLELSNERDRKGTSVLLR